MMFFLFFLVFVSSKLNLILGNSVFNCVKQGSCSLQNLTCDDNQICNVYCNASYACAGSAIICPKNSQCNIYCNYEYSCSGTTVYGKYSSSLTYVSQNYQSSYGADVYCPVNGPGPYDSISKPCQIIFDHNGRAANGLSVFAVEGYNDVNFISHTSLSPNSSFYLFCTENYKKFCWVKSDLNYSTLGDGSFCFDYKSNYSLISNFNQTQVVISTTTTVASISASTSSPIIQSTSNSISTTSKSPSLSPILSTLESSVSSTSTSKLISTYSNMVQISTKANQQISSQTPTTYDTTIIISNNNNNNNNNNTNNNITSNNYNYGINNKNNNSNQLSGLGITLIIISCILFILLIICGILYNRRKKKYNSISMKNIDNKNVNNTDDTKLKMNNNLSHADTNVNANANANTDVNDISNSNVDGGVDANSIDHENSADNNFINQEQEFPLINIHNTNHSVSEHDSISNENDHIDNIHDVNNTKLLIHQDKPQVVEGDNHCDILQQ